MFAFLGSLALAACGGGGDDDGAAPGVDGAVADADPGADGGGSVEPSELWRREAAARCARLYGCCTPTELTGTGFDDEADCVAELGSWLNGFSTVLGARVADGSVVYRPDVAAACLARLEGLTCDQVSTQRFVLASPTGAYCLEAYQGQTAAGQACQDDLGCADGYCIQPPLTGAGTCGPRPGLGQPCRSACAAGLRCVGGSASTAGTCMMRSGVGQACSTTVDCQDGLECVLPAGQCQVDDDPVCNGL